MENIEKMNVYEKNESASARPVISVGVCDLIAIVGFIVVGASTFLDFTPVVAQNWRASGAGLPVLIGCLAGAIFMLQRNYFAGFFISVFSGFFLTHEIIIIYDNKAVELGRELGPNGWFRLVVDVYLDAFKFNTGAFWALVGVLLAMTGVCVGWVLEILHANRQAVIQSQNIQPQNLVAAGAAPICNESSENQILAAALMEPEYYSDVEDDSEEEFTDSPEDDENSYSSDDLDKDDTDDHPQANS